MNEDTPQLCAICGKPPVGETWTDGDEYGDVHERRLKEKEDTT